VHGISTEFLRDKPKFEATMCRRTPGLCGGAEIIIHNAPFRRRLSEWNWTLAGRPAVHRMCGQCVDTLVMAKEMFPGKRNSLDALCDRLEVDNSGRTLHGALLDAELLADVYINMTRGQDALLIEVDSPTAKAGSRRRRSTCADCLPVLAASDVQELEALTKKYCAQIDKSSGGKTVWRKAA
jgi:DNA polymerase-3 subunit epsilon